MSGFREFLLIVAGGIIGSVLGAGFGILIGFVAPEFVEALANPQPVHSPERVGLALGMIAGLMIGATAMVVGRVVGAIRQWAASRGAAVAQRFGPDAGPERGPNTGITRHEGIARGPGR
jgi:hypothetical protein